MSLVIDASVAVKWVLPEAGRTEARALFGEVMFAPEFWIAECGNVLLRKLRRGELSIDEAEIAMATLLIAPVTLIPTGDDVRAALSLGARLDHPIYDCLYLALAIRLDRPMVTADRKFAEIVTRDPALARHVRLLGAV